MADGGASEEAHLAIFNPWVTFMGQVAYVAISGLIYFYYKDAVPPESLGQWLFVALPVGVITLLFATSLVLRNPGPDETLRYWRPVDKTITHLFDLVAVCGIFLLFPHGDQSHKMVALAFCVGYGPLQMISDPENATGIKISILVILGAFAIQLLRANENGAWILTVLFIAYGLVLTTAADVFRNVVVDSIARRRQSEKDAKAIQTALDEVAASRDAKTRFIANASHDLGQPLQAASMMLRNIEVSGAGFKNLPALENVKNAIDSAKNQVGHMLSYLRLEADAVVPNVTHFALRQLFEDCASLIAPQAREKNIELRIVSDKRMVRTDKSLLYRVIVNFATNALVHSGATKVLIGAKSAGADRVRVFVIDNGRGIPSAEIDRAFEDYQQGSGVHASGFGLGLASVKRIANLLGAPFGIDVRWKKGCAAFIELPRGEQ